MKVVIMKLVNEQVCNGMKVKEAGKVNQEVDPRMMQNRIRNL